jgi:putative DNA primase/helicase
MKGAVAIMGTEARPPHAQIFPDAIPQTIKARAQWVAWRYQWRDDRWTKVPCQASGGRASVTDASTWAPFDVVLAAYEARTDWDGIGYVFTAADPIAGLDIDKCREPEAGAITEAARARVDTLASYTEVTPSGTGLHILTEARLPGEGRGRRRNGEELYDRERFFTVTGQHLSGTPTTIEARQAAIETVYAELAPPEQATQRLPPQADARGSPPLTDLEVISKALAARNGGKLQRLLAGDLSEYGDDDSRADLGFLGLLAFWTQDPDQLDRLLRGSPLFRPKWDERRGATTYGRMTIDEALAGLREYWQPAQSFEVPHGSPAAEADDASAEASAHGLPFQTAREMAGRTPERPDFIAKPWVARGAITEVDGKLKASGKTTWITQLTRAVLRGEPFLEEPTQQGPVVYLTEQTATTFREALRRAGLLEADDLHILSWPDVRSAPWEKVAAGAIAFAERVGAALLIVDTLPQFSGVTGDSENSAGEALRAMAPLQTAAARGLAVVVARHERKGGGEVGESGRGSSAYSGVVDTIVSVRRPQADAKAGSNVRVLHCLSRLDEVPETLAIELTPNGYIVHGTTVAYARARAEREIATALSTEAERAQTADDLAAATQTLRTLTHLVLRDWHEQGVVGRAGTGRKGNPYRYWRLTPEDTDSSIPIEVSVVNESKDPSASPPEEPGADRDRQDSFTIPPIVNESNRGIAAVGRQPPLIHSFTTHISIGTDERNGAADWIEGDV